jgi:spermidine synthase
MQVLLIRRALALAGGDEVVFALTLSVWLICVSLGSALGSKLTGRKDQAGSFFAAGLALLSLSGPFGLLILHEISFLSHWLPGTVPGGGSMVVALFAALLPIGLVGGALFPLGCRVLTPSSRDAVASVYLLEAAGAFFAGTAMTLIFAPHISSLNLAVFYALLGLALALTLVKREIPVTAAVIVSLIGGLLLFPLARRADLWQFAKLRLGMELHDVLETPYGLIEITERHGQVTFYENGLLLAISDDPASAEERAHLSLVQHPFPRQVLWIGGSLGGGVEEALRHPSLERLDVIELNPILFDLSGWLNPGGQGNVEAHSGVMLYRDDGRRFLAGVDPESYDMIVINLPGPRTARLSKFYSVAAFRLCRRALRKDGVLVFSITSSEDYIGEDLAGLLASLAGTLGNVFDDLKVLPGENAIFVAGNPESQTIETAEEINARLLERGINPLYWDEYRIGDRFSESRKRLVSEAIAGASGVRLNRDDAPICFYLQQVLWSQQVRGGLPGLLKMLENMFLPLSLGILIILIVIAVFLRNLSAERRAALGSQWGVMSVGLTGIAMEVLALTVYQVYFGSGYREVGLLVGFYMAGLGVGAALSRRITGGRKRVFRRVQALWAILPGGLILLRIFADLPTVVVGSIFFMFLFVVGILGGLHFPLAVSYSAPPDARRAGGFYSLDLIGAALGGLFVGLLALPLLGITLTALGLMLLNLPPLILLTGAGVRSR